MPLLLSVYSDATTDQVLFNTPENLNSDVENHLQHDLVSSHISTLNPVNHIPASQQCSSHTAGTVLHFSVYEQKTPGPPDAVHSGTFAHMQSQNKHKWFSETHFDFYRLISQVKSAFLYLIQFPNFKSIVIEQQWFENWFYVIPDLYPVHANNASVIKMCCWLSTIHRLKVTSV